MTKKYCISFYSPEICADSMKYLLFVMYYLMEVKNYAIIVDKALNPEFEKSNYLRSSLKDFTLKLPVEFIVCYYEDRVNENFVKVCEYAKQNKITCFNLYKHSVDEFIHWLNSDWLRNSRYLI